jgi:hypothetical protein
MQRVERRYQNKIRKMEKTKIQFFFPMTWSVWLRALDNINSLPAPSQTEQVMERQRNKFHEIYFQKLKNSFFIFTMSSIALRAIEKYKICASLSTSEEDTEKWFFGITPIKTKKITFFQISTALPSLEQQTTFLTSLSRTSLRKIRHYQKITISK